MTTDISDVNVEKLTDSELLAILDMPEGQDGLRHYMSKGDKITFLRDETKSVRAEILERARQAQIAHHAYLRARRAAGPQDKPTLIERKLGNHRWRYVNRMRVPASFRDQITGRKAKVAYILQNVTTDEQLKVTKSTVADAFERLGVIDNWPPPRGGRTRPQIEGEPTARELPNRFDQLHRKG